MTCRGWATQSTSNTGPSHPCVCCVCWRAQDATAGTSVAGRLTGWTNSAGTLLGILGNVLTGLLVQATGSFQVVFVVTGALYVSSMLAFTVVLDGRSVHKELQHT